MGGGCGTTNTFYANQVAPAVMKEFGAAATTQAGGCGCMGTTLPKIQLPKIFNKLTRRQPKKLLGGCTGQPTMLRALGIMAGGKRTGGKRTGGKRKQVTKKQRGGVCPCALGRLRGGYKPTKRDLAALRKYKAGKSIGFTMRSSLKAKGLIPRANGTKRISNKYK